MVKLAVFLGNPGIDYARTRHNAGIILLEQLVQNQSISGWRQKFHGRLAEQPRAAGKLYWLKPELAMNLSGKSVGAALTFFKFRPDELLVVHDDLETPFGECRHRNGGGLGGHNGLRSIRDALGSADFQRLRIGIGRPARGDVRSWVLGRFDPDEEAVLPTQLEKAGALFAQLTGLE